MTDTVHDKLPCGIEYGVLPLPDRRVVSFSIRVLAGTAREPADKLGLAGLLEETLDKGTERRTGRELSDAFDALGALYHSGTGSETTTFTCTTLPEHFESAVALHAEMLRTPTLPEDAFRTNLDLSRQELDALEDDPQGLVGKYIAAKAHGPELGRHPLGEHETLAAISRDDLHAHWKTYYCAGRMLVSVAGRVEPQRVAEVFERHFSGCGEATPTGRDRITPVFTPGATHYKKDLEQAHIGICWPGVDVLHDDFPIQRVILAILSGGMSGRLFTEVREKQGLVYWVGAWQVTPRGSGLFLLGASTKPERCDQTYATLLREVDRLAEDIEQQELDRAVTSIVASRETRGDGTRARCSELGSDLFYHGRPVPPEEKLARIRAVKIGDIQRYLATYPRDNLCVVTLGPRPLQDPGVPRAAVTAGGTTTKDHG